MKSIFFSILLFLALILPLTAEEEKETTCNSLIDKQTAIILSEDVFGYFTDLDSEHDSETKKSIFKKSAEYKEKLNELKLLKKRIIDCKYKFTIPISELANPFSGDIYSQKFKGFLLYGGHCSTFDIMKAGKNNSKGIVGFQTSGEELSFQAPTSLMSEEKGHGPFLQFEKLKTALIGDLTDFPVGYANEGRFYFILGGLSDKQIVALEDAHQNNSDEFFFELSFRIEPKLRSWTYGYSPMGNFAQLVILIKNAIISLKDKSGKVLKTWK